MKVAALPPGIRAMVIGAFWFSVMSLLVRFAGRAMPSMQVVFVRGLITLVLSYAWVRHAGLAPLGTQRKLLLLRGALGTVALSCFYFSLVHLPLGEATLIQYMNPVFATLLAAWWIGEHAGFGEAMALAASLTGVLLIARPAVLFGGASAAIAPLHVAIALFGAFCSGAAYVIIRKMGPAEHRLVVVFYLPLMTVPLTLPFAAADWRWPRGIEWLLLAGIGVTTQLAQVQMTRGLQLERSARATMTGYLQIVFAGLWGIIFLGERPDGWSIAGAAIIIGSTLLLARTHREANPAEGDE